MTKEKAIMLMEAKIQPQRRAEAGRGRPPIPSVGAGRAGRGGISPDRAKGRP